MLRRWVAGLLVGCLWGLLTLAVGFGLVVALYHLLGHPVGGAVGIAYFSSAWGSFIGGWAGYIRARCSAPRSSAYGGLIGAAASGGLGFPFGHLTDVHLTRWSEVDLVVLSLSLAVPVSVVGG